MDLLTSDIKIKSFDAALGVFVGIASTPRPDRARDIVEPKGAVYTLPIPLLAFHDTEKPIGTVEQVNITDNGIEVVCRVLKDVTQEAREIWGLIVNNAMKGLSIGFNAIESVPLNNGGVHYKKFEWLELSVVPVAMNGQASITATKTANQSSISTKGLTPMNIAEQIRSFEAKKAEAIAKMDTLITKGVTLNDQDETEYKSAETEILNIDTHIERLKAAEARVAKSAQPIEVPGASNFIETRDNAPKGTDFVRYAKSLALSHGNPMQALEIAKSMKAGNRVETVLKAAVSAGSTTSADFASLIVPQMMANEFIDLLRPATILGKMTPRQVPSNIRIPKATGGTSVGWIGEGKAAPVTNGSASDLTIGEHKIGAIAVFTEELLRRSEPAADSMVRDDMLAAITSAVDVAFIDATNAGIAGIKPAAITNGATSNAASGTTAAAVRADIVTAYTAFVTANHPLSTGVWILHPSTALALSMMRNAQGAKEFEGVTMNGGTLEGLPVITSTNVPGTALAGYSMVLAVQNDILVAEGGLVLDASREASLEFESAPTLDAKAPTAASLVSLWQTGSVAIKAVRGITWARRRPSAVAVVTGAKYA